MVDEEKNVSVDFDEILANGTDEEVEAAIAAMEVSSGDLFGDDEDEELPEETAEVPVKEKTVEQEVIVEQTPTENNVADEATKLVELAPESLPAEGASASNNIVERDGKFFIEVTKDNAGLESKNGKHQLPYDLLVGARGEATTYKEQLEEQRRLNTELQTNFDESKRVSELYSKQLGEAGLDPKLLPEQMLNDPELMAQIKEDYPQIGELVSALAGKLQQQAPIQQAPVQPAQASQDPAEQAFNQSANLKNWQKGDADRWEMAKLIDAQLANNPSFENKTPSERFLEVEKRVMTAFGDEIPVAAAPQPANAPVTPQPMKAPIPNSPTDIGHQGNDLSPNANLLDQDAGSMASSMEGMTSAEIEDLLEGVSNFL